MSIGLIVAGAVFEFVGILTVIAEVAVIRSNELGVPTPWARVADWIRKRDRPPADEPSKDRIPAGFALALGSEQLGAPDPDDSEVARIARLELYVNFLQSQIVSTQDSLGSIVSHAFRSAERADQQLRDELEAREARRRAQLRPR